MNDHDNINFVVGAEKDLQEIISGPDILPLLENAVKVGALEAKLVDQYGSVLWRAGEIGSEEEISVAQSLYLEGAKSGEVIVLGVKNQEKELRTIAEFIAITVNTIIVSNLKRMLTTEIHTTVVNQSYEELAISEAKYRELAENLEAKVKERTRELKKAHVMLLQQEKMAAIGQLAAGVAHEINNPLGFISSNLGSLKNYSGRFSEMLYLYQQAIEQNQLTPETGEALRDKWQKLKLDFIIPDTGELIDQSLEGCKRVTKIVADLKAFSHIDDSEKSVININTEIDRILSVLSHQVPADAIINKKFSDMPNYPCNPGPLCQVFFNIIHNALQTRESGLLLTIETIHQNGLITVKIGDNGPGMEQSVLNRVFEPFFTTRDVGQGSGMGLATAYETVKSSGGKIEVESEPGQGTVFSVTLPVTEAQNG